MAMMQLRLVLGCFTSREALARRRSTYVYSAGKIMCCVGIHTLGSMPRAAMLKAAMPRAARISVLQVLCTLGCDESETVY